MNASKIHGTMSLGTDGCIWVHMDCCLAGWIIRTGKGGRERRGKRKKGERRRSLLNLAINTKGGKQTGNTTVTTACPSC